MIIISRRYCLDLLLPVLVVVPVTCNYFVMRWGWIWILAQILARNPRCSISRRSLRQLILDSIDRSPSQSLYIRCKNSQISLFISL
jgi:hypothetical protein